MDQELYARMHEVAVTVQPIFEANGWTYSTADGPIVPTVDMLESMLASLTWETIVRDVRHIASGRFEVERRVESGLEPRYFFKLVFS